MTDTTTLVVSDVVDELDERLDEIADEADRADAGSDDQQRLDQEGVQVDQRMRSFERAAAEWGPDAELTIAALSPGDRAQFGDLLAAARNQQTIETEGRNLRDLYWVAAGLVDAPFLEGGESIQQRVVALRDLDPWAWQLIQHLKEEVTRVNSLDAGNRSSYAERRSGNQQAQTQR
ncbi:hypothetical protein Hbl1158_02895 [Halobaculum sp. CBA1158]|uniref:hypothetical protein n=1 Tax=Halobaculum sp. CBA1158 TaxID=2904243 RepID=UPI001F39A7FB|nr:hypothetical protein [Halobaculum sp. CBA1158]UIP00334.1 hypothetical protein Hbl1158_02895 [Halobaculum sp. CBA1158]